MRSNYRDDGGAAAEDLLRDLVSLTAPSGFETAISEFITEKIRPLVDDIRVDSLGNLIAVKKGYLSKRSLLLNAHMDEVGLIIRKIEDEGFLRFEKLGATDNQILPGRLVRIHTDTGFRRGVIGTVPAHLTRLIEDRKEVKSEDLYIDVGASSMAQVRKLGINVGSYGGFVGELHSLGYGRVVGKSIDDRIGCAIVLAVLQRLQSVSLRGDLYIVFTAEEEVGLRGASVAAFDIPSAVSALTVDTTVATDTLEDIMDKRIRLGAGPVIQVMDAGIIADPIIRATLMEVAEDRSIPYQLGVTGAGRTDAGAIQRTKRGFRAGVLSIPCRYTHSPVEVADLHDMNHAQELLYQFISVWL